MVFLSFDGEEFEVAASTECDHKTLMDWQIIVAWHCLRDRHLIQPALSELNYTITRAINGMMRPIILLNRKLFIFK